MTAGNTQALIDAIWSCLPADRPRVELSEPVFEGNEWEYLRDCLDSGWVSSAGKYVDRFEDMLTDFTGASFAIATVNGTAALHSALLLAGVESGDEVLSPAFSFIAGTNAISYCGAVPHFIDSHPDDLGVDAEKLADYLSHSAEIRDGTCHNRSTGRPIRALLVMHVFGHPSDLDALTDVCQRFRIELIEDAAEAIGSRYKGRHVGNDGLLGCLSFNGNKTITTGGGGAILCNSENLARHAKHLTTTAKRPHPWRIEHDLIGYNYRMPNLNAALGCAQMEQLPGLLKKKRKLAERYRRVLGAIPGIHFLTEPAECESNYWLNALMLDTPCEDMLEFTISECHRQGLKVRPAWTLQNELQMYRHMPAMDLSVAETIAARLINLPSSAFLAEIQNNGKED